MQHPQTQPFLSPPAGTYYAPKDITFETTKSSGFGFLTGAGLGFGITKLFDMLIPGSFSRTSQIAASAIVGSYLGVFAGFEKFKRTEIYNNKTNVLNRYTSLPDIQSDIYSQIGGLDFQYRQTNPETIAQMIHSTSNTAWLGSIIALCFNPTLGIHKLNNFLFGSTMLSLGIKDFAHIQGMNKAEKNERQKLGFVERLVLEQAATRMGMQRAAGAF